jgi:hypothetical protein
VNTPAMTKALSVVARLMTVSRNDYPTSDRLFTNFKDGRCAVTVRLSDVFKVI